MKKIILTASIGTLFLVTILWLFLFDEITDMYHFSQWKKMYTNESYTWALEHFAQIDEPPVALHNIGNAWYKIGQKSDGDKQSMMYSLALGAYSGALSYWEDEDTRYNYEFVKRLLPWGKPQEEQQEEQEEQQGAWWQQSQQDQDQDQDQESEETESETPPESDTESESEAQENQTTQQPIERDEQYQLEQADDLEELSPREEKQMEQYIETLKQEQLENQRFYNKKDFQETRDIFEQMTGDLFFRDDFSDVEQDW